MASFSSMAPFISDQYDTLKDVIFGGLCFQSEHLMMKTVGVLSWLYLLAFHGFFLWLSLGDAPKWVPGVNCAAELATSHLPVLLTAPKVDGESSGGFWEGTLLPIIYKQVTTSKRHYLLIENVPQAVLSVFFLAIEGGSFFVAALNLVVPGVQIALTFLLFEPILYAAAPALGKRLNRAMHNGNMVAARALWAEARTNGLKHDLLHQSALCVCLKLHYNHEECAVKSTATNHTNEVVSHHFLSMLSELRDPMVSRYHPPFLKSPSGTTCSSLCKRRPNLGMMSSFWH